MKTSEKVKQINDLICVGKFTVKNVKKDHFKKGMMFRFKNDKMQEGFCMGGFLQKPTYILRFFQEIKVYKSFFEFKKALQKLEKDFKIYLISCEY